MIMMKTALFLLFLLGISPMTLAMRADESVPLHLTSRDIHDAELHVLEDGIVEIRTTGSDPYLFTEPLAQPAALEKRHILAFEYFSARGTDQMQVFLLPPLSEANSVTSAGLPVSEGWSAYALDLKPVLDKLGGKIQALRLDFGTQAGRIIRIRSLQLRARTEQEKQLAARREALREEEKRRETRLRAYLQRTYPCRVTQVAVGETQIKVEGAVSGEHRGLFLAEVPLYTQVTEAKQFPALEPLHPYANGRFTMTLPRQRKQNDNAYDRLLSRWAVVRKDGDGYALLSHARYPDSVQSRSNLPEEKPRNKKGVGALWTGRPVSDLDDLGLSAVTVNIRLNSLLYTTPGPGRTPFPYVGRTWYADDGYVHEIDASLQEAAKRRLIVSAIILIAQTQESPDPAFGRLLAHPDADPAGIYVMPNVSSEAGLQAYAAALDFLAQRYSRPDSKYGRIHHWIMHNEVNAGWVWTNAGEKTALLYMELYHKSMRVAHLIARQYNPHAKAFISLEHHWTMVLSKFYAGKELLEMLSDFSRAEGDFEWAIAFHPYPQNLFDPRVWEDNEVNFTFNTPKITFKNLEVLDAWVKQPQMLYLGKQRRTVHLTEQGLNSKDYSEKSLRDQAAGMAYAWNKYKGLDTIEVFHYHNWVDNRGEGGLRIGLRRFPDDKDDPNGRKPIWFLYQALGTDREEEVSAPYKSILGIKDWAEVRHQGVIR